MRLRVLDYRGNTLAGIAPCRNDEDSDETYSFKRGVHSNKLVAFLTRTFGFSLPSPFSEPWIRCYEEIYLKSKYTSTLMYPFSLSPLPTRSHTPTSNTSRSVSRISLALTKGGNDARQGRLRRPRRIPMTKTTGFPKSTGCVLHMYARTLLFRWVSGTVTVIRLN